MFSKKALTGFATSLETSGRTADAQVVRNVIGRIQFDTSEGVEMCVGGKPLQDTSVAHLIREFSGRRGEFMTTEEWDLVLGG